MDQLQEQLLRLTEQLRSQERADIRIQQIDLELAAQQKALDDILQRLEKENTDIERLERMSLRTVFHHILGNKEKQLEKERQDYLQAALKYDELRKAIDLLEYERGVLTEKLIDRASIEQEIAILMAKRHQYLLRDNPRIARQLQDLEEEIKIRQLLIAEMKEAISVGRSALEVLDQMIHFLRHARNWGNWDMMQKRGSLSGYLKHTNLDKARQLSYRAQQLLNHFERELRDVYTEQRNGFNFTLGVDSFVSFTDVFFDNLISDWIIQQRIQNAASNVRSNRDRVFRLIRHLEADIPKQQSEVVDLEAQQEEIIKFS